MTKEDVIDAIRKQNAVCERAISRMKETGDLKYFPVIDVLQDVIKVNEVLIDKMPWDHMSDEDLQSWHNTLLSWSMPLYAN